MQNPAHILKTTFGYESFREGQEAIITSILQQRDVLAVMPTGAGKSLCYQIPGIAMDGICLVITPLISLMKDQVDVLNKNGVPAVYINSTMDFSEVEMSYQIALNGGYKFIYAAPERLEVPSFIRLLQRLDISLIAIDEAHCISQWGHDFRPSYRTIVSVLEHLPKRPVMAAFTATATDLVKEDISRQLQLADPYTITTGYNRENIFFSVEKPANKMKYLLAHLKKDVSSIIYCSSRKTVEEVYAKLNQQGYPVAKYHAGLSEQERSTQHNLFIYDEKPVMVATIAFGMGIDKPNVREVIHYNMSKSMENYYQEAGRCGRDGEESVATVLYAPGDFQLQKFFIDNEGGSKEDYERLHLMENYCLSDVCLRKQLLNYFGEEAPADCGKCSNCLKEFETRDVTVDAQKLLSGIRRTGETFGLKLIADVLQGRNTKRIRELGFEKLSVYGIMRSSDSHYLNQLAQKLLEAGYLTQTPGKFPVLKLNAKSLDILKGSSVTFRFAKTEKRAVRNLPDNFDNGLADVLRAYRRQRALAEDVPPFVIFGDVTVKEIASRMPLTEQELLNVSGIGEVKLKKYGRDIIQLTQNYLEEHPELVPAGQK